MKSIIKESEVLFEPKRTALARISIIRGEEGELYGVPFVDDYVVNTNHIEDYLTRYSGILPGDLDPENEYQKACEKKRCISKSLAFNAARMRICWSWFE